MVSSETNLIRARYYDPRTGRFLSEDPIGFLSKEVNFYRYNKSNPVRFIDPQGLMHEIMGGQEQKPETSLAVSIGASVYAIGGGEGSIGYGSKTDFMGDRKSGIVTSEGIGIGIGAAVGLSMSYTSDINAPADSYSAGYGIFGGSVQINPQTGKVVGGSLGIGVGAAYSGARTKSIFCESTK